MRKDTLVVEISGKRAGTKEKRTTEKYKVEHDHIIISNDSEGYESEWEIVNVPDDYREWYINNVKTSERAWYAPMNRSYAIKYAREHGYRYLVQLDDNIQNVGINYLIDKEDYFIRYAHNVAYNKGAESDIIDDLIELMIVGLENTDAGIAGMNLSAVIPAHYVICERYVYSFFVLDLNRIPDYYQGDFEDDIEFRLKLAQMGVPSIQFQFLGYGKEGVGGGKDFKDVSGCRAEYKRAGVTRGEHMKKLYGDLYSAGLTNKGISTNSKECAGRFKHKIKPFKVGVKIRNAEAINDAIKELLKKYANERDEVAKVSEKKINNGKVSKNKGA